jgi:hypothetical protein
MHGKTREYRWLIPALIILAGVLISWWQSQGSELSWWHLMRRQIAQPQLPIPFLPADQKRKREARVERTTVKIIFTNLQQNKKRLAFEQQD